MSPEGIAGGVDSDRVDVNPQRWRGTVAAVILGVIVGAAAGGVFASSRAIAYTASTTLSVQPDPNLSSSVQNSNTTTLDPTTYIQSQLVILNGGPLLGAVQTKLSLPARPRVSATEVGQTYVVQLTATAPTSAQAKSEATAVAAGYAAQRASGFTAQVNAALGSTRTQITTTQNDLAAAQSSAPKGNNVTPTETALQTELQRLLAIKSSLNLSLAQASQLVTVLAPVGSSTGKVSSMKRDLIGGASLGAIIALALLALVRRSSRRVTTVNDVAALGVPVLLPVMERQSLRARRTSGRWESPEGRLLSARLTTGQYGHTRPIIVVGTTPGVGATYVAASVAAALSRRGPTLLVTGATSGSPAVAHDESNSETGAGSLARLIIGGPLPNLAMLPVGFSSASSLDQTFIVSLIQEAIAYAEVRGWQVVVDTPALSTSDLAIDITGDDRPAALVVGRGVSRPSDVLSAFDMFAARGSRLEGVVLNDVPRRKRGNSTILGAAVTPFEGDQKTHEAPIVPVGIDSPAIGESVGSDKNPGARNIRRMAYRTVPHRNATTSSLSRTISRRKL